MNNDIWYFVLGFLAQGLFSARMLIQWILSKRLKSCISDYLLAVKFISFYIVFCIWVAKGDFVIILGQLFSYYIYIWNLNSKNNWKRIHLAIRTVILLIPVAALCYVLYNNEVSIDRLFSNISLWLLLFGS